MTLTKLLRRRALRRARSAEKDRSIALVVGLMMALVFAPVIGLHVAASVMGPPGASEAASGSTSIDVAAERKARPGPG